MTKKSFYIALNHQNKLSNCFMLYKIQQLKKKSV